MYQSWWSTRHRRRSRPLHRRRSENAERIRLLENGDSPNRQSASVQISGKANGEYVYTAELVNAGGTARTEPLVVEVTHANPAKPVLSADNWDRDGDFTVTANLWWGTNATSWVLLENGVQIEEGALTAATPGAQQVKVAVADRPSGEYSYVVEFRNDAGATSSEPLAVVVE